MVGDASFPLLALQREGILFSSLSREKGGGRISAHEKVEQILAAGGF